MKIKNACSVLISSIVSLIAVGAHATTLTAENAQKVIQNKAACDTKKADESIDCNEADQLFEQIKSSKNVQMIYKIYLQQNVQMEMEYAGHTGG